MYLLFARARTPFGGASATPLEIREKVRDLYVKGHSILYCVVTDLPPNVAGQYFELLTCFLCFLCL